MKRIAIIGVLIVGISACSGTKTSSTVSAGNAETTDARVSKGIDVSELDVNHMQSKFLEITLAKLNAGKDLFVNNCHICHELSYSYGLSEQTINDIVPEMCFRVNQKLGELVISEEGKQLILEYLITINSKRINFESK